MKLQSEKPVVCDGVCVGYIKETPYHWEGTYEDWRYGDTSRDCVIFHIKENAVKNGLLTKIRPGVYRKHSI